MPVFSKTILLSMLFLLPSSIFAGVVLTQANIEETMNNIAKESMASISASDLEEAERNAAAQRKVEQEKQQREEQQKQSKDKDAPQKLP